MATETQNKDKTYWHDAFYEALQLELHQYLKSLKFVYEHQLSKEALIVDVLVIKKEHDIEIEKNIGKIFKAINLFEFKSEKDGLTVDDYNKVMGYGYLYASFTHTSISDITISFAVTIHPRNLLNYLEHDRKFKVTYTEDGICYVKGDTFDVQILESKELSEEKNLFLKNLRSNLDMETAKRTVNAYKAIKEFESKNAYIYRLAGANPAVFKELIAVSDTAIREVVMRALIEEGGWLSERDRERDRERDKKIVTQELREVARGLKSNNVPLNIIANTTKLPLEEVEAL